MSPSHRRSRGALRLRESMLRRERVTFRLLEGQGAPILRLFGTPLSSNLNSEEIVRWLINQ